MTLATLPAPNGAALPVLSGGVEAIQIAMTELKTIRTFVANEMVEGLDYGTVPGCGDKKVLLLPGAQKIAMFFNCRSRYEVVRQELGKGHLEVYVTTRLVSRSGSKLLAAEGIGSASTMETKYRFRQGERLCPDCGGAFIIKGREEYGGGWLCYKKKGGCGAKFDEDDRDITSQAVGRVEVENIHDARNTVLKIAKKRSLVDASISLGCMSELFTQDLDDIYDLEPRQAGDEQPAEAPPPKQRSQRSEPKREREDRRRKQQVNESFKPAETKPGKYQWGNWAPRYLREQEAYWLAELDREGVPNEQRTKLFPGQVNELINLVVSAIIKVRPAKAQEVLNENGKRDPVKAAKLCIDTFNRDDRSAEWCIDTVVNRCEAKKAELRAKLGMLDDDPDDDRGDMYDPDGDDSLIDNPYPKD